MRKDIKFRTEDGKILRGWYYLPDQCTGKVPAVVMALQPKDLIAIKGGHSV